jgi:adenosylmethionine-8-amino-7-oxononanoate aminotransferase
VVELARPVVMRDIQRRFVDRGVWVRPFGRLVYLMPPYVIEARDLARLCAVTQEVIGETASG